MTQKFDLIVIGTGTAGSIIAKKCRSAGWSVAIIDSRPFGGTCALRGCDAKKVLVEEGSDRILGAHLLGSYAEELVNIFALAIRYKLSTEDLKRTTFAFPIAASNLIDIV